MPDLNPRAVTGGNTDSIDYAKEESDRLRRDYAPLFETVERMEAEAEKIPLPIVDADAKEIVVDMIKRIRDTKVRIEALHIVEKQPHFRRGQGVDQVFFGLWDRLMKRDRKNRDGIADVLGRELTAYDVRILAEEQERRRREAEEADRVLRERQQEEARLAQIAEDARLKAERARTPETTATKTEIAVAAETAASAATVDAKVAEAAAEDTYVATLARPADMARTRTTSGTLATVETETYAEIEKAENLDMAKLWPYIAYAEKEKALRAWAKGTGHNEQMAGAKIGRRPKSRVR